MKFSKPLQGDCNKLKRKNKKKNNLLLKHIEEFQKIVLYIF